MLIDYKLSKKCVRQLNADTYFQGIDPIVIDDNSKAMLDELINTTMSIIKPEDDTDNIRTLWIDTEYGWYRLKTGYYEEDNYQWLQLSNLEGYSSLLANKSNNYNNHYVEDYDCTNALMELNAYIIDVLNKYKDCPNEYDNYVNRYVPYSKHIGYIKRSDFVDIFGDEKFKDIDKEKIINYLNSDHEYNIDHFNMNMYSKLWSEGYKTHTNVDENDSWKIFKHNLESYKWGEMDDMTSEKDFFDWVHKVEHHHGLQVIYARIGLTPYIKGNKRIMLFSCHHSMYIHDFFKMIEHYIDIDAPITVHDKDMWINILNNDDMIKVGPNPFLYMKYDDSDNKQYTEIWYPGEISGEQKRKFNKIVKWDPLYKLELEVS